LPVIGFAISILRKKGLDVDLPSWIAQGLKSSCKELRDRSKRPKTPQVVLDILSKEIAGLT